MDTTSLAAKFARIGARLKAREAARRFAARPWALDIKTDRGGEFFDLDHRPAALPDIDVLDVQPGDRHLLLLVREGDGKRKLLCGHDERHWFVAGVPEAAPVGTVRQAKEALKPLAVRVAQAGLDFETRNRRKNPAFVRQGEWFFLPRPDFVADPRLILKWEPIRRGNGGKPHFVEEVVRVGGESVMVSRRRPNGVTAGEYAALLKSNPAAAKWGWTAMRRNPGVYARGRVRHADHKTIALAAGWHQVLMNTENESKAMRNVAFLD